MIDFATAQITPERAKMECAFSRKAERWAENEKRRLLKRNGPGEEKQMTDTWTSPAGKTYRMVRDQVLIRMQAPPEEQNGVALVHSRQSLNNELRRADVLAAGPGAHKRGRLVPTQAQPGDVAVVPHLCGTELEDDDGGYDKTKNFGESDLVDALRLSRLRIVPESAILALESEG